MRLDFDRVIPAREFGAEVRLRLTESMRRIERRGEDRRGGEAVALGLHPRGPRLRDPASSTLVAPDELRRGCLHEWLVEEPPPEARGRAERAAFVPCVLAHVAHRIQHAPHQHTGAPSPRAIVWIGRRCWPCPLVIGGLLHHSIWIDPPDISSRFWAMDVALRCSGVAAVIADGSGLDMAGSRRLQLAAESAGTLGVIVRPASELRTLSAATTRWLISTEPTTDTRPRWSVELLRCKGVQPDREAPRRFVVEWDHAQSILVVPPELAGGPAASARPAEPVPLLIRTAG